jgi:hypothetical protein
LSPRHLVKSLPEIPFTTVDTIEEMLARHLEGLDLPGRAERMLQTRLDQWRGRV